LRLSHRGLDRGFAARIFEGRSASETGSRSRRGLGFDGGATGTARPAAEMYLLTIRSPARSTSGCGRISVGYRAEPRGENSRPQRTAPVSRLRAEGAGGRFDQVAETGRVSRPIPTSLHGFPSSLATVRRGHSVGGGHKVELAGARGRVVRNCAFRASAAGSNCTLVSQPVVCLGGGSGGGGGVGGL